MLENKEGVDLTRNQEDYLEAIFHLSRKKNHTRIKEIAEFLNVKAPSVTEMVQKLDKKGLVAYERYGTVSLTKKGREIGKEVSKRHVTIVKLLKILQVPEQIAERDACIIEHNLNPKTVKQFKKFVHFIEAYSAKYNWKEAFKKYSQKENIKE